MTHTPGPWIWTNGEVPVDHLTYKAPGYFENLELRGPNKEFVAGCDEYDAFGSVDDRCLIAAAPELLEALQGMIDAYWRGSEDNSDAKAPSMVKAALAAINKATQL